MQEIINEETGVQFVVVKQEGQIEVWIRDGREICICEPVLIQLFMGYMEEKQDCVHV